MHNERRRRLNVHPSIVGFSTFKARVLNAMNFSPKALLCRDKVWQKPLEISR
jgi:hypothetical protein